MILRVIMKIAKGDLVILSTRQLTKIVSPDLMLVIDIEAPKHPEHDLFTKVLRSDGTLCSYFSWALKKVT